MKAKDRNAIVLSLNDIYQDAECELKFNSTFELLVAVILSAQCTDKRVNMVTSELFKLANTPKDFALMEQAELEKHIRSCGFYRNKAKNIISCAKDIVARFGGVVPSEKAELKSLAGVGEKTANVVLSTAFKTPAIAVDTHVFRVSRRLGIATGKNPKQVQESLEKNVDKALWGTTHYALENRYLRKENVPKQDNTHKRMFGGLV